MKCPIKAATVTRSNAWERYIVTVNECAADILGIDDLEYIFLNAQNARDFAANLQSQLDAAFADAC